MNDDQGSGPPLVIGRIVHAATAGVKGCRAAIITEVISVFQGAVSLTVFMTPTDGYATKQLSGVCYDCTDEIYSWHWPANCSSRAEKIRAKGELNATKV